MLALDANGAPEAVRYAVEKIVRSVNTEAAHWLPRQRLDEVADRLCGLLVQDGPTTELLITQTLFQVNVHVRRQVEPVAVILEDGNADEGFALIVELEQRRAA